MIKRHYQKGSLEKPNLLDNVLDTINMPLREKLKLFKEVELALEGIRPDDEDYNFLETIELDYDRTIDSEHLAKL
jgi:hypothetical protein